MLVNILLIYDYYMVIIWLMILNDMGDHSYIYIYTYVLYIDIDNHAR